MALKAIERVIRRVLIEVARCGGLITYEELATRISPYTDTRLEQPWSPMYPWLGSVFAYELGRGGPPITSVVVHADKTGPGNGFYGCAVSNGQDVGNTSEAKHSYWERSRESVYAYWSRQANVAEDSTEANDWRAETHVVTLASGRRVRIHSWPDDSLRVTVDDGPYMITSAHLGRGNKGSSFLRLAPTHL